MKFNGPLLLSSVGITMIAVFLFYIFFIVVDVYIGTTAL